MKLVYIAGPYRGADSWEVENNIRAAERVGFLVAQLGAVPVIPHSMYRYWDRTLTDDFWLDGTAELLRRCDAIAMVPGWAESKGSMWELEIATDEMRVPAFYALELDDFCRDVAAWLEAER